MTPVIEAKASHTYKDMFSASLAAGLRRWGWYMAIFALAFIFSAVSAWWNPSGSILSLVVLAIVTLLPLSSSVLQSVLAVRRLPPEHRSVLWRFFPDHVEIQNGLAKNSIRWAAFFGIREIKSYFLFYTHRHIFLVLPKRAFANDDAVVGVRRLARENLGKRAVLRPTDA